MQSLLVEKVKSRTAFEFSRIFPREAIELYQAEVEALELPRRNVKLVGRKRRKKKRKEKGNEEKKRERKKEKGKKERKKKEREQEGEGVSSRRGEKLEQGKPLKLRTLEPRTSDRKFVFLLFCFPLSLSRLWLFWL
jgi:hypothetical protein